MFTESWVEMTEMFGRCLEWGSKDIMSKKDVKDKRVARF